MNRYIATTTMLLFSGSLAASPICDAHSSGASSCTSNSSALSPQIPSLTTTTTSLTGNPLLMTLPGYQSTASVAGDCPMIHACGVPGVFGPSGRGYRSVTMLPQAGPTYSSNLSFVLDKETLAASGADFTYFFRINFIGKKPPFSSLPAPDGGILLFAYVDEFGQMVLGAEGAASDVGSPPIDLARSLVLQGDASIRIGMRGRRTFGDNHYTDHFFVIVKDMGNPAAGEQVFVWVNEVPAGQLGGAVNEVEYTQIGQKSPVNFHYGNLGTAWRPGAGTGMRPVIQFDSLQISHW
jgi:hypothetical protein